MKVILEMNGVKVGEADTYACENKHKIKASLATAKMRKQHSVKMGDETELVFKWQGKRQRGKKVFEFVGVEKQ